MIGPIFRIRDPVTPSDGARPPDKIVPDIVPRTRMRAGSIQIKEGHRSFESTYDDEGKHKENVVSPADPWIPLRHRQRRHVIDPLARPPTPRPISLMLGDNLDPNGVRPDALAPMILALERSPGRVRVPAVLPSGAQGVWARGLLALRRRVFSDASVGRFVIADGLDGTSFGTGPTLEDAQRAWDADLFRAKLKPPA